MRILDIIILLLICITNVYYLYIFCSSFLDKRDWVKGSKIKRKYCFCRCSYQCVSCEYDRKWG